jgi:hypothetical protein
MNKNIPTFIKKSKIQESQRQMKQWHKQVKRTLFKHNFEWSKLLVQISQVTLLSLV